MKRRNFIGITITSLLLLGCAVNSKIIYYAKDSQEVESMKKRLSERNEKITNIKFNKIINCYVIQATK